MSTEKLNYTLIDLIKYFLKLGSTGFGSPVALVGYMHRDLVEDKKWINDSDFKEGLAQKTTGTSYYRYRGTFGSLA